eukprot:m.135928 g.135928  ORF g.135928 m.135928 type:complete len:348 (+) comp11426_c0_seq2:221-1264(+)
MGDTAVNMGGDSSGWDDGGAGSHHNMQQPPPGHYAQPPQEAPAHYNQPPTNYGQQGYTQPPGYHAQQQPPQGYTQPPGVNPAAMAAAMFQGGQNNPLGGAMGMAAAQFGEQQFNEVHGQVSKYVNMGQVKFYFQVNTTYVLGKLRLLLLPFHPGGRSDPWTRIEKDGKSLPPKDDINAPDLYIPVMAFLTYVLSVAIALGAAGKWSPELLGTLLSQTIGWITFEVFLVYAALWLMNVPSHPLLELTAFCCYKFVGMCFSLQAYLVTKSTSVYFVVLGWNSITTAIYLVQTIRNTSSDELERRPETKQRALYVAIALGVFQGLMMFWFTWSVISALPGEPTVEVGRDI